jgi:serine/threonine protein kinase
MGPIPMLDDDPPPHRMQPGTIVDGRYRITQRSGYMGGVATYTATHLVVGRNVQLDVLTRTEDKAKRRFRRGGRLLGLMSHPNIVMLYDMGLYRGEAPYMSLEYLEGHTLQERVEQAGPMPLPDVLRIAGELLGALGYVHGRRIVHRALSTSKIRIGADWQGSERITVTGFAMSRDLGAAASSSFSSPDQVALADFAHVAPEQILAPESVDQRTDLYAVAVTLYQLLAGVLPYPQTNISELGEAIIHATPEPLAAYGVPPALEAVLFQCLAKEPDGRIPDAAGMLTAIHQAALDG